MTPAIRKRTKQLSEPIDILAIAVLRWHNARVVFEWTFQFQKSPEASLALARTKAEFLLASADLDACDRLIRALSEVTQ